MPSLSSCRDTAKSLLPILDWLPQYNVQKLRSDAMAGITVGLMVIPQGLAYAQVAELPVQYGLYSAFMGPFIYCLLGTSKDTTLGPTAIMSLMAATYNLAPGPAPKSPTYAVLQCFACGLAQLAVGLLRLGPVVNFISLPVVSAFTTSAAVTIAWGQVKSVLGLKNISTWLPRSVYEIARNIGQTNHWDLIMGLSCMVILILLMKVQRDVTVKPADSAANPGAADKESFCVNLSRAFLKVICSGRNALIVSSAGLIAYALKQVHLTPFPLTLTPKVQSGLPPFRPPDFQLTNGTQVVRGFFDIASDIGIGFAVIPFIGLVETIAITRVFSRHGNYRIDASQELIAIGMSNFVGSFVASYPVTGSFSRTAVNFQCGVQTPAGGLFTGSIVLLALALLGDLFQFVPQSALASVIIIAVIQMTDFRMVIRLWSISKTDLAEWSVTFVFALLLGLEYGIVLGIVASFVVLLYGYSKPEFNITVRQSGLSVLSLKSEVRFPAAETLQLNALKAADGSDLCVDLSQVTGIDFSIVDALLAIQQTLRLQSKSLSIVATNPALCSALLQVNLPIFQSLDALEKEYSISGGTTEVTPLLA